MLTTRSRLVWCLAMIAVCIVGSPGCGTLPTNWCKTEKAEVVVVGEPQIEWCTDDLCEAARGQYIVNSSWMFENAKTIDRLIRRIEEGE